MVFGLDHSVVDKAAFCPESGVIDDWICGSADSKESGWAAVGCVLEELVVPGSVSSEESPVTAAASALAALTVSASAIGKESAAMAAGSTADVQIVSGSAGDEAAIPTPAESPFESLITPGSTLCRQLVVEINESSPLRTNSASTSGKMGAAIVGESDHEPRTNSGSTRGNQPGTTTGDASAISALATGVMGSIPKVQCFAAP